MRPQHITAENTPGPPRPDERSRRFNEAAAYHCGKRTARKALRWARLSGELRVVASMRPQTSEITLLHPAIIHRNYPVVKDLPGFERFPALGRHWSARSAAAGGVIR